MKLRTLALLCCLGMGASSAAVWELTPTSTASAETVLSVDAPPSAIEAPPELEDRSHFVAGQTLMLDGRLGHAQILSGQSQSTYLLATITGAPNAGAPATPLDLTIVMDTSGSMRGDRLRNAVEAARGMVRRMRDQDRVTVITYSSRAQLLVPQTTINSFSREQIASSIVGMRAQGDTCISCALSLAMNATPNSLNRVSRILLLSDGEATQGVQNELGFRQIADQCRAMGTTVTTIGVDVDYNERVMGALAQFSNGRHYFVDHPSGLPPVFDQEFLSLSRTVANGVELVVDLAPGVQVERVFDRAVRREQNRVVVPIGAVGPGDEKTFLIGLRVPAGSTPEREVASVRLTYEDLITRGRAECNGTLAARTADDPTLASQLDPLVSARLSRSLTVQGVREANEAAEAGQFGLLARRRLAATRAEVSQHQTDALSGLEGEAAAPVAHAFEEQTAALDRAGGGFSAPGLAAPAATPVGRAARRSARAQSRSNTAELVNPFSE